MDNHETRTIMAALAADLEEAPDDAARWRAALEAADALDRLGDRRLAVVLDRAADYALDRVGGPLIIALAQGDRAADAALWAVAAPAVRRLLAAGG